MFGRHTLKVERFRGRRRIALRLKFLKLNGAANRRVALHVVHTLLCGGTKHLLLDVVVQLKLIYVELSVAKDGAIAEAAFAGRENKFTQRVGRWSFSGYRFVDGVF